jgi:lipopolysaccharide heptosyltransferase I
LNDPARILIIRPSALGDVCRSVPVLASVRARWPAAHIDWLVQDSFASAVRHHPMLSGVIEFPRRSLGNAMGSGRIGAGIAYLEAIRRGQYDLVIDVQGLARSGLFCWATGAPRRVGYANAREGAWLGYNERHRVGTRLHAVDRMLELARLAGIEPVRDMRLYSSAESKAWVRNDFRMTNGRYAVLAPTSRWPGKRWAIERFTRAAEHLMDRGLCVAIVGSSSEREQCGVLIERAKQEPRIIDLVGSTSVGQLMALIEHSAIVLANDSAALHMAVGFDRPCVGLYGPTRLSLVGPYIGAREPAARSRVEVVQHVEPDDHFDHKSEGLGSVMMARISVAEVLGAIDSVLRPSKASDTL